ncbi:MAG: hypothetical protein E7B11_15220 [Clostridiales bacterium]|nr:hypothetical protein [Clostridiales bacterium]MDU3241913.1 hypothetical protein [Clostridiales bacterium]
MELTDFFLDTLAGNYCQKNIQQSLNLLELVIKEEEEYYKSELPSATSELQATWDLIKEFRNFLPQHSYLYEVLKEFM